MSSDTEAPKRGDKDSTKSLKMSKKGRIPHHPQKPSAMKNEECSLTGGFRRKEDEELSNEPDNQISLFSVASNDDYQTVPSQLAATAMHML